MFSRISTLSLAVMFAGGSLLCRADSASEDYSNGPRELPRSFSAVKDPDFKIADYEQDSNTSSERGYLRNTGRESAGEDREITRSGASARRGSGLNLNEESQSAATSEGSSDLQPSRENTAGTDQNAKQARKGIVSSVMHHGDKTFARHAAEINTMEISMGRLAAERASDQRVKDFANKLVEDHNKANDTLLGIDEVKGWNIQPATNDVQQKAEKMTADWKGADFDKQFIDHMVRGHAKAAKEYKEATDDVNNPALKDYAQKTLPVIQEHLNTAKSLQADLGGQPKEKLSDKLGGKLFHRHQKTNPGNEPTNSEPSTKNDSGNSANNM